MTEEELNKMTELIDKLEKESHDVDALMSKLARLKGDVKKMLEAFDKPGEGDKSTFSSTPSKEKVLKALAEQPEGKLSTGNEKLDSLLYGGIPPASNIVLRGPPFSGKSVIANNFLAQSLKDGIPVVILTADRDIREIKKAVARIHEGMDSAEEAGMVRFIDAYSRSIQSEMGSSHAIQVDPFNVSALIKSVDSVTSEVSKNHGSYRFLMTSLTTFITQQDEKIFVRFLQQISQKRRTENALSFYILEDGLFDQRMYEAVSYLMDGAIHLRKTFTTNYLRVEGLSRARSREWIEMYPSENGFDLGSFTLERVR